MIDKLLSRVKLLISSNNGDLDIIIHHYLLELVLSITLVISDLNI